LEGKMRAAVLMITGAGKFPELVDYPSPCGPEQAANSEDVTAEAAFLLSGRLTDATLEAAHLL
jgi:hypothetical protein